MPPKVKYSKEEIVEAAYELIRKEGSSSLTARHLAAALGTSTAPIFTAFESIDALNEAVLARARAYYDGFLSEGLSHHPIPFKGSGLAHIRFAKEEPLLFRYLFVDYKENDPVLHYLPGKGENEERVRSTVENYGYETESAKRLYNHLAVYVHGLSMLYAFGHTVFDEKDIDSMLSEVFYALKDEVTK